MAHVKNNSGQEEWYTPSCYIESARKVMGSIDFDPCSCEKANTIVKATHFFTKEQDAITTPWPDNVNVWCNPPYSRGVIGRIIEKFIHTWIHGDPYIREAIFLTNNATETKWGNSLLGACNAVCFPNKRIKFLDQHLEESNSPIQAQMITYFGGNREEFREEFSQYGVVLFK